MKIIRGGDYSKVEPLYRFTCWRCDAEWECFKSECTESYVGESLFDGSIYEYKYKCPCCEALIAGHKVKRVEPDPDECPCNKRCSPNDRAACCGCTDYWEWRNRHKDEHYS